MGFFLSFSQAAAVPDRSSRGRKRVTERWWPSGTRGGGSREKEKARAGGGASRGRKTPLPLLVSGLESLPTSFVPRTPLNKNWLVPVPPGKNRQIQEYLCLQRIYGDRPSPQPPNPWRFLVPRLLLGVLSCLSASSLGNFIPIPHLQIPWGSQCPSFLGYGDLPTSNPGNRVSHSLDLLFLFYKD